MNRRHAVKLTSLIVGASVTSSAWLAILQSCSSGKTGEAAGTFFNEDQANKISSLAELIIPKTDTPGSAEAGVPDFIEKFVQFVYTDAQQKKFMDGLEAIDKSAKDKYGRKFLKISDNQKNELLGKMNSDALADPSNARDPRNGPFILMVKELTLLGYFTSMPGATQTLQYLPIPGMYNGCMPLSEVGRAWATD